MNKIYLINSGAFCINSEQKSTYPLPNEDYCTIVQDNISRDYIISLLTRNFQGDILLKLIELIGNYSTWARIKFVGEQIDFPEKVKEDILLELCMSSKNNNCPANEIYLAKDFLKEYIPPDYLGIIGARLQ